MRYLILSGGLALSLLIGVLLIVTPAQADSTITVTTTSDAIASNDGCSLREAIIAANTDSAFGDCPAGSGADTIVFDNGLPQPATFVLTNTGANEDDAQTGDLDILGTLTISGTGTTIIDGNGTDRVFQVLPGARATIDGVTIRYGNPGSADGGGVAVDLTARLTLSDSTVISNTALGGGGIKVLGVLSMHNSTVAGNQGGGIRNDGGLLTLSNVQVINNTDGYGIRNQNQAAFTFSGGLVSGNEGGGIYNATSSATLNKVTIVNNTGGGGVYNTGGTLSHLRINRGVVMTNTATSGAGILNEGVGAVADIYDVRISGNTATSSGGGIFNNGSMTLERSVIDHNQARSGGGIEHFGGTLRVTNATLSSNTASDNGGGLYNENSAILKNVTLDANVSDGPDTGGNIFNDNAQLSIENSIVAHSDADGNCFNSGGLINSLGYNLDDASTCGFGATGDITGSDPQLGLLQDNGGHTLTHALLPASPALDAGDCSGGTVAEDQRGVVRPQGAACDIGAFELGSAANLSIVKTVATAHTPVLLGDAITYTVVIANSGDVDAAGVRVTDTLPVGVTGVDLDWTGTITAADQVAFTLPALVTTSVAFYGQTVTNTAYFTHTTGSGSDSASFTIASAPLPQLTVTKTVEAAHTPVRLGDLVTYTIAIANDGTAPAQGVILTDALPTGVTFGGWISQGSALPPTPTDIITWGPWDLSAGASPSAFSFTATVTTSTAYLGESISNTVVYNSDNAGSGSDDAAFTIASAIGPDLSGSGKTSDAAGQQVAPGALVTFTITLVNSGGADASVVVTDALESYYVVDAATDFIEAPAGTLTWSGTVQAGQQVVLQFVAQVVDIADLPIGTTTLSNTLSVDDGAHPLFGVPDASPPWVEIHAIFLPVALRN